MFRQSGNTSRKSSCFPHSRGDVPFTGLWRRWFRQFSPLTWGCSGEEAEEARGVPVFPTHVGMFRTCASARWPDAGFPHSRGDVPGELMDSLNMEEFSPLTWGCSGRLSGQAADKPVFPTHVGMFRPMIAYVFQSFSFPHSRGDVPSLDGQTVFGVAFSPLTWGCSGRRRAEVLERIVFPTHVGMFRRLA